MSDDDTPAMDAARTFGPEDGDASSGVLRAFAREVGDKLERILKLLEPMPRIEAALADVTKRVRAVEHDGYRRDAAIDELRNETNETKKRVAALEAAQPIPRKKARKC